MFHELPPKVRRGTFREFARVLKPVVALCSLIHFSRATNGLRRLLVFPQNFHERITSDFKVNFGKIVRNCGFEQTRSVNAFVSKVMI